MESIDRLEQLEQTIIQHIRTSAIPKQRELLLVDEVLTLRTERRRYFSNLQTHVDKYKKENEEYLKQLATIQQSHASEQEKSQRDYKTELQKRTEELQSLQHEYELEKRMHLENMKILENEVTQKLKRLYDSKLNIIEIKLKEVMLEKQTNDLAQAKVIADNIVKKVTGELEEKYQRKVAE
jgi:hypothetical protein